LMQDFAGMEGALGSALGKLSVVVEAYPDLKANQNMMQVSEELTSTENKVSFSRQNFNDSVMSYNVYKQSFPNNIVAGMFGHAVDATLLEFEDSKEIQAAPKVQF
jgi:LemA protein